jgi:hypothetical protein
LRSAGEAVLQLVGADLRAGRLASRGAGHAAHAHAYETERDIQRGLLVGITYKSLEATTYVFNPDVVVLSVGFSF